MLDLESSNSHIRRVLELDSPFMVGRLGLTEATVCWHRWVRNRRLGSEIMHRLSWGVGLFPVTDEMVDKLILAQRFGAMMADAMLWWGKHRWESDLLGAMGARSGLLDVRVMTAPLHIARPWTDALAGMRVLVVHPFAGTITSQYENRRDEVGILPQFDLRVVASPVTVGRNRIGTRAGSWSEALSELSDKVRGAEFDVALIACGGYGLPLAGDIRKNGLRALVVGGGLQLLFGIKGRRWDRLGIYNDAWVRPAGDEVPSGHELVEKGCYW